jgi:hypothetical protein
MEVGRLLVALEPAALEQHHADTGTAEFEGKRDAGDAASDDADFGFDYRAGAQPPGVN